MVTACCFYWGTESPSICLLHLVLTSKNSHRCYLTFPHSCSPHRSRCCSIMSRCLITWPWSDYGCLTGLARYATATVNWCQQFVHVPPHAVGCGVAALLQLRSVHVGQYQMWHVKHTNILSFFFLSTGSAVSPSLHHQGQKEQIGLDFSTAVYILYNIYSILLVFVYIYLFSLFCIFEKINLKCQKTFCVCVMRREKPATILNWLAWQTAPHDVCNCLIFSLLMSGPACAGCCLSGRTGSASVDRPQSPLSFLTVQHLLHVSGSRGSRGDSCRPISVKTLGD